jgi:hypothetical protein
MTAKNDIQVYNFLVVLILELNHLADSTLGNQRWRNNMTQFLALTCLKCGGKLQIRDDKTEFTCPYCGTPHLNNQDGMISLVRIEKSLKNVEKGVDKTAAELAIRRLKEELSNKPFGGNRKKIKNDIWDLPRSNTTKLVLLESLDFLLQKQDPNRKENKFSVFLGHKFNESELQTKFFSILTDEELSEMINYCEEQEKNPKNDYPESYKKVRKVFLTIVDIYAIKRSIERNNEIVDQ